MERWPRKAAQKLATTALVVLITMIVAPAWVLANNREPLLRADAAGSVVVFRGLCPADPEAIGCSDPPTRTVWVAAHGPAYRGVLEHERGHVLSYWELNEEERLEIARVAGWGAWREERFADAFAACRLSARQRERIQELVGFSIGRLHPAVCRLVRDFT